MNQRKPYRYQVVDVFTQVPLEGNPLAVFSDAADLDSSAMQKIALEMNLSETVFIVPARHADCVARLRIFTPRREMAFAGHPTVGSAFLLTQQGYVAAGTRNFLVEENVGAIPIALDEQEPSMLWLTTPPITDGPSIDRTQAADLMMVASGDLTDSTPQVLSAGNPTLFIPLRDKSTVDKAAIDTSKWTAVKAQYGLDSTCIFIFAPTATGAYSRMLAPDYGVVEDPATGSSAGPLAVYMMRHGMASSRSGSRFVSEQGTLMGRRSMLHVRVRGENGKDGIDVGGFVTPIISGELRI